MYKFDYVNNTHNIMQLPFLMYTHIKYSASIQNVNSPEEEALYYTGDGDGACTILPHLAKPPTLHRRTFTFYKVKILFYPKSSISVNTAQ